ncbi:MAG: AAA family ATPase [Blastocatellia bacterium]
MKFPYGIADFHKLITEDYFYVDRTGYIPLVEEAGAQLLFLRPRRFGKSLWLSTLENYYDLARADEFDRLFGHLAVGREPTPKRNQYFILKWDFSAVDPSGDAEQIRLYVERLKALLLPEAEDQMQGRLAAETLYQTGDLQPLCDFIEQRYFKVFSNRDYLHANELTVKTAFLTLLFNNQLYFTDSETAVGRRYADLTMIARPDARQYQIFDLLLEFKFVKLGDLGLSGDEARWMSRAELAALPAVREKLAEARARELRERYKTGLRLRTFAVVALGFERVVWEEISEILSD